MSTAMEDEALLELERHLPEALRARVPELVPILYDDLRRMARGQRFKLSGGESTVLIFGWVAVWAVLARFHPDRQFWHDAWAGTRLITSKPMSRR